MNKSNKIKETGFWEAIASRNMDFLKATLFTPATIKPLIKILGAGYSIRISEGGKNFVVCYVKTSDIERLGQTVKARFLDRPAAFRKFLAGYQKSVAKLQKDISDLSKIKISLLGNRALARLLKSYFQKYIAMCPYGVIGNRVATAGLAPIIKEHLLKINYAGSFDEALSKLILPPKETFIFQEEQALLKLAKSFSQNSLLKNKIFRLLKSSQKSSLPKLLSLDNRLKTGLNKHLQEFRWILLAMYHEQWPSKLIFKLAELLKLKPGVLSKKVFQHQQSWLKLKTAQQQLLKKIRPTTQVIRAIKLMGDFVALRDHFGPINRYAPEEAKPLLKEAARRLKLTYQEIIHLTKEEIITALLKSKSFKPVIKLRQNYYVIIDNLSGQRILTGSSAKQYVKQHVKVQIQQTGTQILTGQIACRGKIQGRAKVVFRIADLNIVKQGDILVSPNTTTEMMRAIKKVAGIVTDEGGLGSHAAIVSREFSLPCIVGTKIGTKVIKTGDLIEVDANQGIVKKL